MKVEEIRQHLMSEASLTGDADQTLVLYDYLLECDEKHLAATAINRAFGLRPDNETLAKMRELLLDELSIEEFGIRFRYIPAGPFLMGSELGDLDEQPIHPVVTQAYWLSETPVTWAAYCDLMNWDPAPNSFPHQPAAEDEDRMPYFCLSQLNKIRMQYCETETTGVRDWHAHAGMDPNIFGEAPRENPDRPMQYDDKPMVAVSWSAARELATKLNTLSDAEFDLPTEAQWEKGARGGLIQREYPWGDEEPDDSRCDVGHEKGWRIASPKAFPPNGYGLHGMAGGVWEWVRDRYDALAYSEHESHVVEESDVDGDDSVQRVLRGGAWCDCAPAVRVAFRMGRASSSWRTGHMEGQNTPTIGFRLCRMAD